VLPHQRAYDNVVIRGAVPQVMASRIQRCTARQAVTSIDEVRTRFSMPADFSMAHGMQRSRRCGAGSVGLADRSRSGLSIALSRVLEIEDGDCRRMRHCGIRAGILASESSHNP
jgi:hypothetical protein